MILPRSVVALVNQRAGHPGDQLHALLQWAAAAEMTIARTVEPSPEEVGRICEDVRTGVVGGAAAATLDSIGDLVTQEAVYAVLTAAGGVLHLVDEGDGRELAAPAEEVRELLRLYEDRRAALTAHVQGARLSRGRQRARAEGRRTGGRTPYGWKMVAGQMVEDAREQAIRTRTRALWDQLGSYSGVARQLKAEGYERRDGSTNWHAAAVRRILLREDEAS